MSEQPEQPEPTTAQRVSEVGKGLPTSESIPKLTKQQYELLLYFEQYYWRTGQIPTYEIVNRDVAIEEPWFYETIINPRFNSGLKSRGLPDHVFDKHATLRSRLLSEKQMMVANTLMDTLDKRSKLKKLTELGVSTKEYNLWLRDPIYREYCLSRAEQILLDSQPVAHLALVERVSQGDLGAIRYYNAMVGRYRERVGAAVEVNIQNNNFLNDMVMGIIEIIQRHVKDPSVLAAIGDEILALQAGGSTTAVEGLSGLKQVSGLPEFNKPTVIQGRQDYGI